MTVRTDKCCTFGMSKANSRYTQFSPCLFNNGEIIPVVKDNEYFVYLGKIFNFEMKNNKAKQLLIDKLLSLLRTVSSLRCKVQLKLKILRLYVHSQLLFDLKLYKF